MVFNKLGVGPRPTASSKKKTEVLAESDRRTRLQSGSVPLELDKEWMIGGKYEVLSNLALHKSVDLTGEYVGEVQPQEVLLLLQTQIGKKGLSGLVVPPAPRQPGWVALEDPSLPPHNNAPILRRHLPSSWKMKARYRVLHPATLRSGPLLSSEWVGEVAREDEVLVLELGLNSDSHEDLKRDVTRMSSMDQRTRLRMLISTDKGLLGWMSPETSHGEQLLDPINLLGSEAIPLSRGRRSVTSAAGRCSTSSQANGRISNASTHSSRVSAGSAIGPTPSALAEAAQADVSRARPPDVSALPWKVGGHYRSLEDQPLLADISRGSAVLVKVAAGCVCHVLKLDYQQCPGTGWCPFACVVVQDGEAKGHQGWVRCISQDGFDLIDTRDQLQFDRVTSQIERERQRRSQMMTKQEVAATAAQPAAQASQAAPQQQQQQPHQQRLHQHEETSCSEESSAAEDAEESETGSDVSSSAASEDEEPNMKTPIAAGVAKGDDHQKVKAKGTKEGDAIQGKSLQDLELGASKEELNVMDVGTIQDESWASCLRCSCGSAGRNASNGPTIPPAPTIAKAN